MEIAKIKRGRIDQGAITFLCGDFKSPQSRFSKRVFDSTPLISVVAVGAIALVRYDQQNARAGPLEAHDVALTKLSSIQTDIIRSNARGQ